MKIRTKITLLISALVLVSLSLVFFQYLLEKDRMGFLLGGLQKQERDSFNFLLDFKGADLATYVSEYGYWDDMVDYVHKPDPVFAAENIEVSITTYKSNEAYVYDVNQNLVYSHYLQHPTYPPVFTSEQFKNFIKNRRSHFFVKENGILTEFRVHTIHPSNDPDLLTEPQGVFMVGRRWDGNYLKTLEELSGDVIALKGKEITNTDVLSITFPYEVYDINGKVAETFIVTAPFPIVNTIKNTSTTQLWIVVGSLILMIFLIYFFLSILVGKPIETLSHGIEEKDYSLIEKMKGDTSEFGSLAKLVLDFSEHAIVLQAKAKDEAILSAVGSGLIAVNKEKMISLFNTTAENLFGITADKALGLSVNQIFQTETREGAILAEADFPLTRALNERKVISEIVLCVRSDGKKFPAAITAAPVLLDNEIIGAVQDLRDITEEETLERSKRDFISLVSHELRTPLTSLGWAIEKIESVANIPESISKTTIPYMRSSLIRIKTLAAAIVDVSKIENGSIITANTDIKVSTLITHSVEDVKSIIEAKKITVSVNDETNEADQVKSDERLLQIIISNIISNAFQYCNDNGQVQIGMKKEGQELLVNVLNTGEGIPAEEQDKIFSKMFRAKNASLLSPDGAGLGLYISKSFLERLGGSISFVSTPGKETIFTIHLPLNS